MFNLSRRDFLASAAAASGALALSACSGSSDSSSSDSSDSTQEAGDYTLVNEGQLTCIAEMGFAPFEYMDENTGEPLGFDIDLMDALATQMGLTCNWLASQKFDTLIPTIKQGGKADAACSGITINDERAKEIDFTDPYMDSNQSIVMKAGSAESGKELKDVVADLNVAETQVACQAGTTGDEWIDENLPNAQKVSLDDVAAAMAGVQTGLYTAFVIDLPVSSNLIQQSYSDLEVVAEVATGEQYGIAVSKDNPNLTAALNQALADIKSDGTMDELEEKWFGTTL